MIPGEAVFGGKLPKDAVDAAKAVFGGKPPRGMRLALAAAAPYLMADAWEDGYHASLSDGYEYQTANPYRSAEAGE